MEKSKEAKRKALMGLKSKMHAMGGETMMGSMKKKKEDEQEMANGGVVKASVIAKDKEGLQEGLKKAAEIVKKQPEAKEKNYDEMSREELVELLKRQ